MGFESTRPYLRGGVQGIWTHEKMSGYGLGVNDKRLGLIWLFGNRRYNILISRIEHDIILLIII